MHIVCRIDKEIYKCVTEDIRTDEVIITNERIEHIIERRGKDFYDTYSSQFANILKDPDYIFMYKQNTALVSKYFNKDGKSVNIVLRIAVSSDHPDFKNSILTAIMENPKRFQQRLRNNSPLYKKE